MADSLNSVVDVTVRPARGPEEHGALAAVWRSAVEATHDFLAPEDVDHYEARLLGDYLPAHPVHVAAGPDGRPLGFIGLDGAHVNMLFVDAAVRGRGIGDLMLAWAAERHPVLTLDVNEQNPQAIAFYRRKGFVQTGRSPLDDEGRPFPILHMRRDAAPE